MTFLTSFTGLPVKVSTIDIQPSPPPELIDGYSKLWAEIGNDGYIDTFVVDRQGSDITYVDIDEHYTCMHVISSAPTTVANSAYVKLNGTTEDGISATSFDVSSNNRITWNGNRAIQAHVSMTGTLSNTNPNRTCGIAIYVNGEVVDTTIVEAYHAHTGAHCYATQCIIFLNAGDYMEIYGTSSGTSTSITLERCNVTVRCLRKHI